MIGGQPVEHGWIRFESLAGDGPTAGGDIEHGRYRTALAPGRFRVAVQGYKKVGEERIHGQPSAAPRFIMEPILPEPGSANAGEKTIAPGRNTIDFLL